MRKSASFLTRRSKKLLELSVWGVGGMAPGTESYRSLFATFSSEKVALPS
jgi:hypothetical protein